MKLIWLAVFVCLVPLLAAAAAVGGPEFAREKPTVAVRVMVCKTPAEHAAAAAAACVDPQLMAYATTGFVANSTLGGKMWGFQAFASSGIHFTYQKLGPNPYFVVSIEKVAMTPAMAWYVTVNNSTGSGSTGGIGSVALDVNDEVDWLYHKIATTSDVQ